MIEDIVESFANAALFVKTAGFDMCQVHGGHGWLLAQFYQNLQIRELISMEEVLKIGHVFH